MKMTVARVAGFSAFAALAVIGTICLLDVGTSHIVEAKSADDLIGNDLLEAQAKAIDGGKKKDPFATVDDMMRGFQKPKDDFSQLTEDLKKAAPKSDDLEVGLSPDRLG